MENTHHQHDVLGLITAIGLILYLDPGFWMGVTIALICNILTDYLKVRESSSETKNQELE